MEQLKLLMDYTIFHIGVYISLSTGLVTLLGLFPGRGNVARPQLLAALVLFLFAGICGGMIAAHIPHAKDFDAFYNAGYVGAFGLRPFPAWITMGAEHAFFWIGVAFALWGFWRAMRQPLQVTNAPTVQPGQNK